MEKKKTENTGEAITIAVVIISIGLILMELFTNISHVLAIG